jgi:hypothetical protein
MLVLLLLGALPLNFCAKFVKQITSVDESIASAQTRSGGFPVLNGWLINQASLAGKSVRVRC